MIASTYDFEKLLYELRGQQRMTLYMHLCQLSGVCSGN
jgi:hypothetical protein